MWIWRDADAWRKTFRCFLWWKQCKIEDDDKHDDETGPDSEDNDDEIVYTIEAEIPKYKERSA